MTTKTIARQRLMAREDVQTLITKLVNETNMFHADAIVGIGYNDKVTYIRSSTQAEFERHDGHIALALVKYTTKNKAGRLMKYFTKDLPKPIAPITPAPIEYETGATSHAVNDLILFTDNTRELAELRDRIFAGFLDGQDEKPQITDMAILFRAAGLAYKKEFGHTSSLHIIQITASEVIEYCKIYAQEFIDWKNERKA